MTLKGSPQSQVERPSRLAVIILAAGQGQRMMSTIPKVLHKVLEQPLLRYALDVALSLTSPQQVYVVASEQLKTHPEFQSLTDLGFQTLIQEKPLGTGHALLSAAKVARSVDHLLVLNGDVLVSDPSVVSELVKVHLSGSAAATILTTVSPQPGGYGRIIRDGREGSRILAIREDRECLPHEKEISEINLGFYCFQGASLWSCLETLPRHQTQQGEEIFITDCIAAFATRGWGVQGVAVEDPEAVLGINDRVALWQAERSLQWMINQKWMLQGVTLHKPEMIFIDSHSEIGMDSVLEGPCTLIRSQIAEDVHIFPGCRVVDCVLEKGVRLLDYSLLEKAVVEKEARIGPFARLRPGSHIGSQAQVGNFIEIKNSKLGAKVKANHLSYLGDAEIGSHSNIGCGFITCNFDGQQKHKTLIGSGVFIGSDSQAVAPLSIGDGSYIGAGTTLTKNVAPHTLVTRRALQKVFPLKKKRSND